jgi:flagellar hook-associated protein FlgK
MLTSAISSAMSGIKTSQRIVDMSSNNIANIDTPGYKRLENKNFSIPALSSVSAIGIGVGTNINATENPYVEKQMQRSQFQIAEKVSLKEAADSIAAVAKESGVAEAYASMTNAAKELAFNKNDPTLKTIFNAAGKDFSTAIKNTQTRLDGVSTNLTNKISLNEIQIQALQNQLAEITKNAPSDSTPANVNYIQQQLSSLTGSISGYKEALSKIIPPVTASYTQAITDVKLDINTKFGAELLDSNNNWTSNTGNITAVADSELITFGNSFGSFQAEAGSASNSALLGLKYATDEYTASESEYKDTFGVDLATETLKVANYKKMYEANAKVFQVADSMLGTLLDIVAR